MGAECGLELETINHGKNGKTKKTTRKSTLQGTNISHLGRRKNHLQKCLGIGYVSSLESKLVEPPEMWGQFYQMSFGKCWAELASSWCPLRHTIPSGWGEWAAIQSGHHCRIATNNACRVKRIVDDLWCNCTVILKQWWKQCTFAGCKNLCMPFLGFPIQVKAKFFAWRSRFLVQFVQKW